MPAYSVPGAVYGKYVMSLGQMGIRVEIRKCVLPIGVYETADFFKIFIV